MEKCTDRAPEDLGTEAGSRIGPETSVNAPGCRPVTGQGLVAALHESGFVGLWRDRSDIGDSREFARSLRVTAVVREAK
jgi:hypothetical protein